MLAGGDRVHLPNLQIDDGPLEKSMKIFRIGFSIVTGIVMALAVYAQQAEPKPGKPITIPTRYIEERFYAVPVTQDNVTLLLFTDSAGSITIYNDVVDKLGLKAEVLKGGGDNGKHDFLQHWDASVGLWFSRSRTF